MACDFNSIDKNDHKSFDERSFQEYIDSPMTQSLMKKGIMFGTLSHKARAEYKAEVDRGNLDVGSQSDYLLATGQAATNIKDMYIKDHKLYITVCTLPLPQGIALEKLIDAGIEIMVSMSTEVKQDDDHYYIVNLFGLDHTTSPAFNVGLVSVK
jgi:hypothetical protein